VQGLSIEVIAVSNAGERKVTPCETLADAKKLAREMRTPENQSVKICDPLGTMFRWSRIVGVKSNRWAARTIINDVFLGPE
jgi:hypothetical protein